MEESMSAHSVTVASEQSQASGSLLTQHTHSSRSAQSPTITTQTSSTQKSSDETATLDHKEDDDQTALECSVKEDELVKIATPLPGDHSEDVIDVSLHSRSIARGQFSNKIEFTLSLVSNAVGLGNIWRFPYLLFNNGGGAFLIPYFLAIFVVGIPFFYLELALGQFSSFAHTVALGHMAPIMQGLGWAMSVLNFSIIIYYQEVVAWGIYYLFSSFQNPLPWATCKNEWNTINCLSILDRKDCVKELGDKKAFWYNSSCHYNNETQTRTIYDALLKNSSAGEYFDYHMYQYNYEIVKDFRSGHLQWALCLCLLLAYILTGLPLVRGVKSLGKAVYVTSLYPYIVITIFVVRGALLDGAKEGVIYYLKPQLDHLTEFKVWKLAWTQIFFSLSPCLGVLTSTASYNPFHENIYRTALIVVCINCMTSFFAGFAVFTVLGFMAHSLDTDIRNVVKSGPTLVFVTYPEAMAQLPVSQLWSIMFFLMILMLGIGSTFTLIQTLVISILDTWPILQAKKWRKIVTLFGVCFVCFLFSLTFCVQSGDRLVHLVDNYVLPDGLLYIGIFEVCTVSYLYGIKNLVKDLEMMMGKPKGVVRKIIGRTGWVWRIMWLVLAPLSLVVIFIAALVTYERPKDRGELYPGYLQAIAFVMSFIPFMVIIGFGIYKVIRNRINKEPWKTLIKATENWCPGKIRKERRQKARRLLKELESAKDSQSVKPKND